MRCVSRRISAAHESGSTGGAARPGRGASHVTRKDAWITTTARLYMESRESGIMEVAGAGKR